MPLDLATTLSAKLVRRFAPRLNPKRHKLALDNLRVAFPEKTEDERLAICLAQWENLGRVLVEMCQLNRILRDPSRIEIVGQDILSRYRGKLGALIGVSLHMGNWELAIWPLTASGANPAALYRSWQNPYIDRYLRRKREALYPGGMFGRGKVFRGEGDDHRTAQLLSGFVRSGGRLGIVCDQYYRRGVPVPFFGKTLRAQPIAAIIARRLGARIWMARCVRVGTQSHFKIEIKELRVPRTSNQAEDIRSTLNAMMRQFEHWIREAPEQAMWAQRKW